jgi:hypothetical protein
MHDGVAGGTIPYHEGANDFYSYVFFTDTRIYAVTFYMWNDTHRVDHDIG